LRFLLYTAGVQGASDAFNKVSLLLIKKKLYIILITFYHYKKKFISTICIKHHRLFPSISTKRGK